MSLLCESHLNMFKVIDLFAGIGGLRLALFLAIFPPFYGPILTLYVDRFLGGQVNLSMSWATLSNTKS